MEYRTAGESHGHALTVIVSGVPAGVPIDPARIDADLARRQRGYGRGGRQVLEQDRAIVLSGVRHGLTLGSPVSMTIANRDWDNWVDVMAVDGEATAEDRVTAPRPGHADLAGVMKTGTRDVRDVLERASARETAARVAAGGVAKAVLDGLGVAVTSWVESIGDVECGRLDPDTVDAAAVEASDTGCPDPGASERMRAAIDKASAAGDTLGGTFAVAVRGAVPGLGGYAEARSRLDARLAAAVMSIPAIKGVEIGEGFASARKPGSEAHDTIVWDEGTGFDRTTNRAGGIEGGMTNGSPVVVRAAMKPIPTLASSLSTVDLDTHEVVDAARERADVCAVPAAAVVAEAEVAIVIADAYAAKFGGDCLEDMTASLRAYVSRIRR